MKLGKWVVAGTLIGGVMMLSAGAASAMPLGGNGASLATPADSISAITDVQFRRGRRGGPGWGPAVGIGLGTMAIIGGIAAAEAQAQAARRDAVAYCMSRFRSYNPETGTYVGRDGRVRPCP